MCVIITNNFYFYAKIVEICKIYGIMAIVMQIKRFFNYRPLVSICLFFMAGIVFVSGIFSKDILSIIIASFAIFSLILTVVLKCVYKSENLKFKIISICLSFIFASLLTFTILYTNDSKVIEKGTYQIQGVVCYDYEVLDSGKIILTIDDVKAVNIKSNKQEKIKKKIRLYLEPGDNRVSKLKLGDKISITANLTGATIKYKGNQNYYLYNKNISAIGYASEEGIEVLENDKIFVLYKIKNKVKRILDTHLSEDYSNLGYTMLFGDKAELSETIKNNYSASGISHLLAVSGLHVGFIVTILSLILSLLKVGRKFNFYFISISLFLYAMLCGFTVSVVRAFIMTVVILFCKMKFKEYDGLSSLSFAAIIILLLNPLQLFDIGFRLSFCAVLSIMLLNPVLTAVFDKFLHKKLASAFAVAVSATVGTLPIMCLSFDKISILSVIANIFLIPIASTAFMFLFMSVIFALILPAFGVFTYMFELLMKIVTISSSVLGEWNLSGVNGNIAVLFSFLTIAMCLVCSDYIFLDKKKKLITSISISIVCVLTFTLMFVC